jgi:nucleotide-binding universal stress UspA family protein/quercetin dioxygenase-like cupin family protein
MPTIQTILHPTDLSASSRHAFQLACTLAKDYQARLILFHVIPAPVGCILPEPAPNPLQAAEAQESLRRWHFAWPEPLDLEVRVEHRVAEGDASQEVLRLAKAERCDLIVMGTHGRTGLSRLLDGSVAEEVVRKAACPVLAVRSPPPVSPPAEVLAKPGDIVGVRPLGPALAAAQTKTLVKAEGLEVIRLVVRAGEELPERKAKGIVVISCLEGRVTLTALGRAQDFQAGELLYLPPGEPYSLRGVVGASLLMTALVPKP